MSGGAPERVIVYADGGSRGNPGLAGYGAAVVDAQGRVSARRAKYIGTASNNVAEYGGLIAGLTAADHMAPGAAITVRMDSKLVVEQMSGRWKIKHPDMKELAAQARELVAGKSVAFEWIPRAENKLADGLANEAMDAGAAGGQWEERSPEAGTVTAAREGAAEADAAGPGVSGPGATELGAMEPAAHQDKPATEPRASESGAQEPIPPATFLLFRHAETSFTQEQRFNGGGQDAADPEVADRGRERLQLLGAAVPRWASQSGISRPVAAYASPAQRCQTTAKALHLPDLQELEDLRDMDFGQWDGLPFAQVKEDHPREYLAVSTTVDAAPPGGETKRATFERVCAALRSVAEQHAGQTVAVVSHGFALQCMIAAAAGMDVEGADRFRMGPASSTALTWNGTDPGTVLWVNRRAD